MLPVAIVGILFACAVVTLVVKSNPAAKAITLVALGLTSVLSVIMLVTTGNTGPIELTMGMEPWNVSISVGVLEAFMSTLFSVIGFLIMWASVTMIEHDVEEARIPMYYALICALIATLCGVVFFDNMVNIFIFIELSSFAAAGIVIIKNEPENLRAGLKYLTLSILGSSLVLMGIVILYTLTGSLTMDSVRVGLETAFAGNEISVLVALCFVTAGVCFKSALFPCHIWLPDAHGTAPSPSSATLSSLVLKAYIIFYIKFMYRALGPDVIASDTIRPVVNIVLVMGVVAMLAGSILAIMQTDIKRMIAYSSVAQIGYVFMGIGLGTPLGLQAAIFHILAHAVTKSCLFLVAGSIIEQTHERRLEKMGGLGKIMPITMTLFTIGALSMVGIPLFVGFNSKWNFALAIMNAKTYWVMIALSISSLLNALYYLPVVVRAFFGTTSEEMGQFGKSVERPISALLPIMILGCFVVVVAVTSTSFMTLIQQGTASLLP